MLDKVKLVLKAVRFALRPRVEGIHPEEVFSAILKHEHAVAERNNYSVTVLTFKAALKDRISSRAAQVFGRVLVDRLRATDVAGWLDPLTIGVLLPNTQVKDALLVAEQICQRTLSCGIRFDYQFYRYPRDERIIKQPSTGAGSALAQ